MKLAFSSNLAALKALRARVLLSRSDAVYGFSLKHCFCRVPEGKTVVIALGSSSKYSVSKIDLSVTQATFLFFWGVASAHPARRSKT